MIARAAKVISLATPAARYSVGIVGVRIGGWALIISSRSTATIEHEHRASSDHHPRGKRFHHNRHVEARWLQPIEPRLHVETNLLIICTKSDDEVEPIELLSSVVVPNAARLHLANCTLERANF